MRRAVISLTALVAVPASVVAQTLAGGFTHTVIVKPDGTVWSFG